ncbi:MAG: hypothetical protein RLY65_488 [Pseudomonadota bacterium]
MGMVMGVIVGIVAVVVKDCAHIRSSVTLMNAIKQFRTKTGWMSAQLLPGLGNCLGLDKPLVGLVAPGVTGVGNH